MVADCTAQNQSLAGSQNHTLASSQITCWWITTAGAPRWPPGKVAGANQGASCSLPCPTWDNWPCTRVHMQGCSPGITISGTYILVAPRKHMFPLVWRHLYKKTLAPNRYCRHSWHKWFSIYKYRKIKTAYYPPTTSRIQMAKTHKMSFPNADIIY